MRNLLPKPKRLFSFLILFILVASSLLIFFPRLVSPAQAQPSRLQYYGVDQAQPGDFEWLSQQGINLVMVNLSGGGGGQSYYEAARANGIKLIPWPNGGGMESTPWYHLGGNNWDISQGHALLDELVDNNDVILAILALHEAGNHGMPMGEQKALADKLREYTRNRGHELEIYFYADGLAGWQEIIPGQMDWAGIWQHTMCGYSGDDNCQGGEGTKSQSKQIIRNDRAYIDANGLDTKLLFAVQTYHSPAWGITMPSYQELYDFTCDIIQEGNLDAVWYYSWEQAFGSQTKTLKTAPDLHPVIRDVYDNCIQGLPSVSPTSTPTPGGPPSTPTPTQTSPPTPTPTPSGSSDYIVLKTDTPPVIDGNISEFDQANTISITQSSTGTQGTYKLLWDDNALYIACSVSDAKLNASISQEDGFLWTDDSIELMFDTLNNHGSSQKQDDYKFFVNLLNTHRDENMTNGTWDGPYTSAVILQGTNNNNADTDQGYTIEIRIPWSTLGLSTPSSNTTLGFDVVLNDKDASGTRNYTAWANTDGGTLNNPDGWNDIELSLGSDTNCPRKSQGDANCDGSIDGIDYSLWLNSQCRRTTTQSCASTKADFNNDSNIDDEDYEIWFKNRG